MRCRRHARAAIVFPRAAIHGVKPSRTTCASSAGNLGQGTALGGGDTTPYPTGMRVATGFDLILPCWRMAIQPRCSNKRENKILTNSNARQRDRRGSRCVALFAGLRQHNTLALHPVPAIGRGVRRARNVGQHGKLIDLQGAKGSCCKKGGTTTTRILYIYISPQF